jgi:Na+:H+ antiporter, NhaA family
VKTASSLHRTVISLADTGKLPGILLILATVVSMVVSNTPWGHYYINFWDHEAGPAILHKSVLHWVNDALMAVFFLMVGLEIKREVVKGELSTRDQAIMPVIAAAGGMLVPALIYSALNAGNPMTMNGWAIPTATDIAFSLGILSLLGNRVPSSIKIFLTALAIIDDLGAILIIALFYASHLNPLMLILGLLMMAALWVANKTGIRHLAFYLVPGILLWYFIMKSGIHATIAGVMLALVIPMEKVDKLEHALHKPVNYFILPLFALANTALAINLSAADHLISLLGLGVTLGLFIGKPLGIFFFPWVFVKIKAGKMMARMTWKDLIGLGILAGIGFTMSIFIASLSFKDAADLTAAKLAIILGSLLSAVAGVIYLGKLYPKKTG